MIASTATWDRFWSGKDDPDRIYRSSPKVLAAVLAQVPNGRARILEIGAGTGRDAGELARLGHHAVALDASPEAWRLAARAEPALRGRGLVGGDAFHLPFPDRTFDAVFHQGVLEHFGNPTAFLAENLRVTRPGGVLVVDVPQTFHAWTLIKRAALRADRWFAGWETDFTIAELERLVRRAGWEVRSSYGDWMVPSLAYRLARETVGRAGVELPMVPPGPRPLARARRALRERMLAPRAARWVAHTIGVIARRPVSG